MFIVVPMSTKRADMKQANDLFINDYSGHERQKRISLKLIMFYNCCEPTLRTGFVEKLTHQDWTRIHVSARTRIFTYRRYLHFITLQANQNDVSWHLVEQLISPQASTMESPVNWSGFPNISEPS